MREEGERGRECVRFLSGNLLPFRHQNDNHRKVEWKSTKIIEQCQRRFTSFVGVIWACSWCSQNNWTKTCKMNRKVHLNELNAWGSTKDLYWIPMIRWNVQDQWGTNPVSERHIHSLFPYKLVFCLEFYFFHFVFSNCVFSQNLIHRKLITLLFNF